jgi:RNA polymerase sigma factor (sigma-70 family)
VEIASAAPHEPVDAQGRPGERAARARTEAYYASYGRTVGGLCRALLRDAGEAEDAAQQVFLSAYRALLNGSDPREPAAWLATIARHECWARVQARMREPLAAADVEGAAGDGDPLEAAIRRADLAALWSAIRELPQQQRDALLLREFDGLSYDELAVALAVTTPAVESLLFRARRRLRARLRAVHAALGGGSWLEGLWRVVIGSSPAVATKAVALGFGAAAVTGGAVATPALFQPVHFDKPAEAKPRAARPKPPALPAPTVTAAAVVVLPHTHRGRHSDTRDSTSDGGGTTTESSSDGSSDGGGSSSDG